MDNQNVISVNLSTFFANLQKAVAEAGITPCTLAENIGMNKDTVRKILNSECDPKLSTVISIVKGLRISMDQLLSDVYIQESCEVPKLKNLSPSLIEKIAKMSPSDVELLEAIAALFVKRKSRAMAKLLLAIRNNKAIDDAIPSEVEDDLAFEYDDWLEKVYEKEDEDDSEYCNDDYEDDEDDGWI